MSVKKKATTRRSKTVYIKALTYGDRSPISGNVHYTVGIVTDPLKFNPHGSCTGGGLYFIPLTSYNSWSGHPRFAIVKPIGKVYKDPSGGKFKAHALNVLEIVNKMDLPAALLRHGVSMYELAFSGVLSSADREKAIIGMLKEGDLRKSRTMIQTLVDSPSNYYGKKMLVTRAWKHIPESLKPLALQLNPTLTLKEGMKWYKKMTPDSLEDFTRYLYTKNHHKELITVLQGVDVSENLIRSIGGRNLLRSANKALVKVVCEALNYKLHPFVSY